MKPTTHKARIAVIGTGWWATYAHLPALLVRADDVELVALANRGEEKLAKAADAFDVAKTYTDYRVMLDEMGKRTVILQIQGISFCPKVVSARPGANTWPCEVRGPPSSKRAPWR